MYNQSVINQKINNYEFRITNYELIISLYGELQQGLSLKRLSTG